MEEASNNLNYERALEYKNMIDSIRETIQKQVISLNDFKDRDFIAYDNSLDNISIQILFMRNGKIVDAKSEIFPRYIDANDQVLSYLAQFYDKNYEPEEVCFDEKFNLEEVEIIFKNNVVIPKIGDKKKIINIALKMLVMI